MNIKGLTGIQTQEVRPTTKLERSIKSDSSHERDANGQQSFEQKREQREPMTEEEIQKAIEYLKSIPSVKDHKWEFSLMTENDQRFVVVKDNLGTIIRRIPEYELWTLPVDKDDTKGQLLKKSA